MGVFETSDQHGDPALRPIRVPVRADDLYGSAREMVDDLKAWRVVAQDEAARTITCERDRGFLGGKATITIRVEGPDGVPSSAVHVRSESQGGLLAKDKANVVEFNKPFHRRVC